MKYALFLLVFITSNLSAQQNPVQLHIFDTASEVEEEKPGGAPNQPLRVPSVLVERILTLGKQRTRISLFDNRVAVVTIRENGKQVFFRMWTLSSIEYDAYVKAFGTSISDAGLKERDIVEAPGADALIHLGFPGYPEREFHYSPLQILDLPTGRLISILDDLEKRISSIAPSAEELQHWQPEEGDRVELYNGMIARVEELREGGVIVLQYEETFILQVVPFEAWPDVIFRILK